MATGWPAVRDKCGELGISFRPWQHGAGQVILAKREGGKYAATVGGTGLSIPRQVGKTFLVGAIVFALCLLRPNLTVIWTAHRLRTAEETFGKMQAFARRKSIAPHVLKVVLGSGEEEVRFRNGSRILFGARESGFGLGFDEVDVLIFDEAQRLKDATLEDMVPATNQSRQPAGALLLFMGTPPRPSDAGEVFRRMRSEALSGDDEDTAWIEFGADKSFTPTPLPEPFSEADWHQVAKANPSFPADTPREAILRMRKQLGPEAMLREGFGIWDEVGADGPFSPGAWKRCASDAEPPAPAALGLALDLDRVWLSLGASSAGEVPFVGAVMRVRLARDRSRETSAERSDTGRVAMLSEVERIHRERGVPVVIDAKGPAAPLIDDLEDRGVTVIRAGLEDCVAACADVFDRVEAKELEHGDHPDLNDAVRAAGWRKVGDRRVWSRRTGDVSMLEAVTLARVGADHPVDVWGVWT